MTQNNTPHRHSFVTEDGLHRITCTADQWAVLNEHWIERANAVDRHHADAAVLQLATLAITLGAAHIEIAY